MIPKFKQYISESVWGDIRKKSLGKEERLEGCSMEELRDTLKEMYWVDERVGDTSNIMFWDGKIEGKPKRFVQFPLCVNQLMKDSSLELAYSIPTGIQIEFDNHMTQVHIVNMKEFQEALEDEEEFRRVISEKYDLTENWEGWPYGDIKPKQGFMTKQQCIEIIDKILMYIKDPLVRKQKELDDTKV